MEFWEEDAHMPELFDGSLDERLLLLKVRLLLDYMFVATNSIRIRVALLAPPTTAARLVQATLAFGVCTQVAAVHHSTIVTTLM
jgi:hypothetical protein